MASRKTYFGIGFKDPNDPESGPAGAGDPQDRSQPTVVDDEKVAEGLRQLRSWYQGNAQPTGADPVAGEPAPSPASTLGGGLARPTAVGHATAPPSSVAPRPIAPDPMRATMYGHDVHQFDLDLAASGGEATPAAGASTALVLADPGLERGAITRQGEAVPTATPWPRSGPHSDGFPMARHGSGEAERLQRPPAIRQSSQNVRPKGRVPVASRVMFAVGMVSLAAALAVWLMSSNESDAPAAQRTPPPISAPSPPPVVPAVAPQPTDQGSVPPASSRPAPGPTPVPIPAAAAPKTERPRAPTTPAALRTPRKPREPKIVEEAKTDDEDSAKDEAKATPKDEPKPAPQDEAKAAAPKDEPKPAPRARSKTTKTAPEKDSDETLPPSEM